MSVALLNPHENMSVGECLSYASLEQEDFQDVIVLAYDQTGELIVRSSHMSRKDAVWMLLEALDHSRGK